MTEKELRTLVRRAIAELLAPRPRRALVVFTGGLVGFDQALAELAALAADGVQLDYVQTPSAGRVLDQDRIRALGMPEVSRGLVADHQMLIAPTLTSNIAAKAAHGIADCLASNLFSEFLMSGRLVVASSSAISPDDPLKQAWFPHMPPAYAELLRANLAALAGFGVRLTRAATLRRVALAAFERAEQARVAPLVTALGGSPEQLRARLCSGGAGTAAPAIAHRAAMPEAPAGDRRIGHGLALVSQRVVQRLPPGSELRIPAGAKVTAMARDIAAARSIRITRES